MQTINSIEEFMFRDREHNGRKITCSQINGRPRWYIQGIEREGLSTYRAAMLYIDNELN